MSLFRIALTPCAVAVVLGALSPMTSIARTAATPPRVRAFPIPSRSMARRAPTDYAWLRDKRDPEVVQYLEEENAYTDSMTAGAQPLRESIYAEMLSRIKQTDLAVPLPEGRLPLLHAHRGGSAVLVLLPPPRQPWTRPRRC